MFFQSSSCIALAALAFFSHASTSVAGHARPHHHLRRFPMAFGDDTLSASKIPRSDAGSIEVPLDDLHLLQIETTAFQQWMKTWLDSETTMDPSPAIALLKQEIQAYEGWINAWLDSAMSAGGPPPPPLPSSIPVTLPPGSSLVLPSAPSDSAAASSSSSAGLASPLATSTPPTFQEPTPSAQASSPSQTSFVTRASQNSTGSQISTSLTVISVPTAATPIASDSQSASANIASSASAPAPSQPGPSSGSGQFDAQSSKNVAVYYGQTDATAKVSLGEMCQDANVDIVVLAFLNKLFGPGGFPTLNFGAACNGQTPQMESAGATGLLSCPDMASQITQCQGLGKKVLLSLGGSNAVTAFPSDSKATDFANQLWDLFGAGTGVDAGLRPFGDVRLDGFDVDNEDHSTLYYSTFVSSLRKAMNADSSRTYYISAAPQCIRPDASIPLDAMQSMDFIFVQFYNNLPCNIGSPGFAESFKAWSSDLSANGAGPKLFIGAPGCQDCAGSGYVDAATMASTVASAKAAGVSNFGGIMLWDGPTAFGNVQNGKDYTAVVKDVLA